MSPVDQVGTGGTGAPRITLATLHQASAQAVFEQVGRHLLAQGDWSWREIGDDNFSDQGCAYRGEHGRQCGAGNVIGDDEYQPAFEGRNWTNLREAGLVPEAHFHLIRDLQHVHDLSAPSVWPERLADVAEKHGLQLPPDIRARRAEVTE